MLLWCAREAKGADKGGVTLNEPMLPKVIEIVEWVDPNTVDGWQNAEKALDNAYTAVVVSVGMLVAENDLFLLLALDWSLDGVVNSVGTIYKPLIRRRKQIKLPATFTKKPKREAKNA